MKTIVRSTLLVAGVLAAAEAPAGDLVIGHARLHLGMPQAEVLAAVSREFDPAQVSVSEGKFLLWTKRDSSMTPRHSAGTVSFKDGKLYRASKNWGEDSLEGRDVVEGFYRVFAELAGREGRSCRITAEELSAPAKVNGQGVKLLTIEMPPDRRIRLTIYLPVQMADGKTIPASTSLDEFLVEAAPK